jgi:type VI secretion system secreted protein Hcp
MHKLNAKPKPGLASLVGRPLLAGAIAAGAAAPGGALADVFLKLTGIPGESTDAKHKGEIEILSYTQSFKNPATPFGGGGGSAGKVECGEVTVLKNIDASSPGLIKSVTTGKRIDEAVLTFRTAGRAQFEYYKVTLKEVFITAIDQSDQQDPARIVERVQLTSATFKFEYRQQKGDGSLGSPVEASWDCKANRSE